MLLPLGATFISASPWPRKGLVVYTLVIAGLGLLRTGLLGYNLWTDALTWPETGARIWLAVYQPVNALFVLGAVLSLWAGNIVMSIRWRR